MTAQLLNQIDLLLHDELPDINMPRTFSCLKCLKKFRHPLYLDLHARYKPDCVYTACPECETEQKTLHPDFNFEEAKSAEKKPRASCAFCDKWLGMHLGGQKEYKKRMQQRKRTFKDGIECVVCSQEVDGVRRLHEHYDTSHPRQSHKLTDSQRPSTIGKTVLEAVQQEQKPVQTKVKTEVKHRGETRSIICAFCDRAFRNKQALRTHTRSKHPDKGDGVARVVPRISSPPVAQAGSTTSILRDGGTGTTLASEQTKNISSENLDLWSPATNTPSSTIPRLSAKTTQACSAICGPLDDTITQSQTPTFRCTFCRKSFVDASGLKLHTRSKHGTKRAANAEQLQKSPGSSTGHTAPPVPETSAFVVSTVEPNNVTTTTSTRRPVECNTCQKSFGTEYSLARHTKAKHADKGKGKAREASTSPRRSVNSCPKIPSPENMQSPEPEETGDLMFETCGATLTREELLNYLSALFSKNKSGKGQDNSSPEPTQGRTDSRSTGPDVKGSSILTHAGAQKKEADASYFDFDEWLMNEHGLRQRSGETHDDHTGGEAAVGPSTPVMREKFDEKTPSPVAETTEEPLTALEGPIICSVCGSGFNTNKGLERHCRVQHMDIQSYDDQVAEYSGGSDDLWDVPVLDGEKWSVRKRARGKNVRKRDESKRPVGASLRAVNSKESGYAADMDIYMKHLGCGIGESG